MSHVLAVDPGLRATGYAYFRNGSLAKCGLHRSKLPDRAAAAAEIGREFALEFMRPLDVLIIEVPQVYQARLMKGDPNDLVSITLVAGALLQLPAALRRVVSPHHWKGNVPKDVTKSRVLFALSITERQLLQDLNVPDSLKHNVVDAIGLGQWLLSQKPPSPIARDRRSR